MYFCSTRERDLAMSVVVQRLTKQYGIQKAVDDLSFEARRGEIVGFLGPNGAGKSTTMKIITCFMPPTRGKVLVCGFDTRHQSMEVRRRIGYLPENNPLYQELYVKEFLRFVARIHQINHQASKRIEQMISLTGLTPEQHKKIGQLSKGYRQRVGLAQALIHDPDVLILDEPTSGLDPNQLVEIRHLIKELGKEKTVILSTHILQEVQAMCDRVIIINKGKKVADEEVAVLTTKSTRSQRVRVIFKEKISSEMWAAIGQEIKVTAHGDSGWELQREGSGDLREEVAIFARKNNLTILSLTDRSPTLEEIFHILTSN